MRLLPGNDTAGAEGTQSFRNGSNSTLGQSSSGADLQRSGSSTAIPSINSSACNVLTLETDARLLRSNSRSANASSSSLVSPKTRKNKARPSGSNHDFSRPITQRTSGTLESQMARGTPDDGGTAGFISSTANLFNTAVGTGCLALPVAVSSVGLVPGLFIILASGLLSGLGLWFLAATADCAPRRAASFSSVSAVTFPSAGAFFDLAVAIKCFGVAISYLIIIGDLMPQIVLTLRDDLTTFSVPQAPGRTSFIGRDPWMDRRLWIGLSSALLVPLAFLRNLDSLKYTSFIAILAVAYLTFIVVLYFCFALGGVFHGGISNDYHLFGGGAGLLSHLPIFVFSMTCHQNIYSICNEIRDNRKRSVTRVIVASIASASVIYIVIASAGYMTFGTKVGSNIIAMYPNHSAIVALGRVAIVVLVLFSYPLQTHPCRSSLDKVLSYSSNLMNNNQYRPVSGNEHSDIDDASGDNRSGTHSEATPQNLAIEPSRTKWILMTACIIVGTYALAMIVQQLDTVLSFVGSTGSTAISFILPGLLYVRMTREATWTLRRIVAAALAIYGCLVMASTLTVNILALRKNPSITSLELNDADQRLGSETELLSPTALASGVMVSGSFARPTGDPYAPKNAGILPILDVGRLGDDTTKGLSKNETLGSGRIPGVVVSPVNAPNSAENGTSLDAID